MVLHDLLVALLGGMAIGEDSLQSLVAVDHAAGFRDVARIPVAFGAVHNLDLVWRYEQVELGWIWLAAFARGRALDTFSETVLEERFHSFFQSLQAGPMCQICGCIRAVSDGCVCDVAAACGAEGAFVYEARVFGFSHSSVQPFVGLVTFFGAPLVAGFRRVEI